MDFIKICLIALIAVIAYWLLLQWPPVEVEGDMSVVSEVIETDLIPLSDMVISDSKDSLSALELNPSSSSYTEAESSDAGAEVKRLFYIKNDVLNIGVDPVTGRFVSSEMDGIQSIKDSGELVSIF